MAFYKSKGSGPQISGPSITKYIRKDNTIFEATATGGIAKSKDGKGDKIVVATFKFINQAKKESRKLQMSSDGGLGAGTVRLF